MTFEKLITNIIVLAPTGVFHLNYFLSINHKIMF